MQNNAKKIWRILPIFVLAVFLATPLWPIFEGVAQAKERIYVDDVDVDNPDGSSAKPYRDIQTAINKAKDKGKDVYVRNGFYKGSLQLWEGVALYGESKDKVVIEADSREKDGVEMHHKTTLSKVTIQKGETGVEVVEGAGASIFDCVIKDNKEDGVKAKSAEKKDSRKLVIERSEMTNNGWNGVYSEERKFYFEGNKFSDNDKDGVEFKSDSKGTFRDNDFKDNDGSGLVLALDDSSIYITKSTFKDNDREGMEVKLKEKGGWIEVRKSKFYKNERWGIAKVAKSYASWPEALNSQLKVDGSNKFWDNDRGGISGIFID